MVPLYLLEHGYEYKFPIGIRVLGIPIRTGSYQRNVIVDEIGLA